MGPNVIAYFQLQTANGIKTFNLNLIYLTIKIQSPFFVAKFYFIFPWYCQLQMANDII